ncbi:TadE/TadG family type IV pilus assembly protein [Streptomyces sp. NPDC006879]|uniref:TadE/TadG family type IV pilus assembly protein n=1 Tax=Streptomyces sp. NPDC006879 TaxID=3364767 RepID=UPI00369EE6DD
MGTAGCRATPGQQAPVDHRARHRDRGQSSLEFLGVFPLILLTLAVLWQCAMVGYAFSLAGNAADEGARAGTVGGDCVSAASRYLPSGWSAAPACGRNGADLYTATVRLRVPALFPGTGFDLPLTVTGKASAAYERIGE